MANTIVYKNGPATLAIQVQHVIVGQAFTGCMDAPGNRRELLYRVFKNVVSLEDGHRTWDLDANVYGYVPVDLRISVEVAK